MDKLHQAGWQPPQALVLRRSDHSPQKAMAEKKTKPDESDVDAPKGRKSEKGGPDPIDELSATWEDAESKEILTKELAKEVLSKGAWATVMFLVQDLDRKAKTYRAPKISVRRYKKVGGSYRYQSSFNISSEKQAREMMSTITKWFGKNGIGRKTVDELGAAAAVEDD
jgi:hypothetical protein